MLEQNLYEHHEQNDAEATYLTSKITTPPSTIPQLPKQRSQLSNCQSQLTINYQFDACSYYINCIWTNFIYLTWDIYCIRSIHRYFKYQQLGLSVISYIILPLVIMAICAYSKIHAIQQIFIKELDRAQSLSKVIKYRRKYSDNGVEISFSQQTWNKDQNGVYYTYQNNQTIQLETNYCEQDENYDLRQVISQCGLIFVDFKIEFFFSNYHENEKMTNILNQYAQNIKERNTIKTTLEKKYDFGFNNSNLPLFYCNKPWIMIILKILSYIFTLFGVMAPFIFIAHCFIKKQRVKINKYVSFK